MNTNVNQPTAVLFLRARHVGADGRDREQENNLLAAQREQCRHMAASLGANVIREYAEHGGSGRLDTRPELRLMLDELRALRDVDYVITAGTDRLWRATSDGEAIRFEIEAAGAALAIADQQAVTIREGGQRGHATHQPAAR